MKKMYLFCTNGMSTSLLAQKMQQVADKYNLDIKVKAFPHNKIGDIVASDTPDCILLGPQVKYLLEDTIEKFKEYNRPIGVIDSETYGRMDGEKALKAAVLLMKKFKQKGEE